MFVDEAEITVRGGDGGSGCCSFRREAHVPRGGPDGGDGGDGGSVYLEADPQLSTLYDLASQTLYPAESGRPGRGRNQYGRRGADLVIRIPQGTIVRDADTGALLRDLTQPAERLLAARGGRGGRGNKTFATPTHRTPREYEDGEPGEQRRLALELKLIADVGLIGLPNAGKSTLLSRLTDARPRIAPYPFTTLVPQLGIARVGDDRRLVLADMPGLIQGAHQGVGLGDRFLRHIERTRVLCHLIDAAAVDGADPVESYRVIRGELERYSPALAAKREVAVASKMDLPRSRENADALEQALGRPVLRVSASEGTGLEDLLQALVREIDACASA